MKKNTILFVLFALILLPSLAQAVWYGENVESGADLTVNTGAGADENTVALDIPAIEIASGAAGEVVFDCDLEQVRWMSEGGEPGIPWKVITVLLPPDADTEDVSSDIVNASYQSVAGVWSVSPQPPMATRIDGEKVVIWPAGSTIVDGYDVDIYETDALWPAGEVRILKAGKMHHWKLAEIAIPLVLYNPVSGELQCLTGANISVDSGRKGEGKAKIQALTSRARNRGRSRVEKLAVNYAAASAGYLDGATQGIGGGMVILGGDLEDNGYTIITTDQLVTDLSTTLDDFIDHKENLGFTVKVVTEAATADSTHYVTGTSNNTRAENILDWLQANYVTDETLYVLLIGTPYSTFDTNYAVPMLKRNDPGTVPTDWPYADVTEDFYWELLAGRIPYYGTIADTKSILNKTVAYEEATDVNWRRNVLLPETALDDYTQSYELGEQIMYYLLEPEEISCTRAYDQDYNLSPPPDFHTGGGRPGDAWAAEPFGLVVWQGHGWSGGTPGVFEIPEEEGLDDDYPGATFQSSCQTSWPEVEANAGYALLKNGGIVTVGATRESWYSGQTYYPNSGSTGGMAYEYAERIIERKSCGQSLFDVKDAYGWEANNYVFNIYGDPSVVVMPAKPEFTISQTYLAYLYGLTGGPFGSGHDYTLYNNSGSSLSWTGSETADWLQLSSTGGSISSLNSITVTISPAAAAIHLTEGVYSTTITFTDTTNSIVEEREVELVITDLMPIFLLNPLSGPFDESSNWPGLPADMAFDGNRSIGWAEEGADGDPSDSEWIWADMGQDYYLNSIILDWELASAADYTLRLLTEAEAVSLGLTDNGTATGDLNNWTTIATASGLPDRGDAEGGEDDDTYNFVLGMGTATILGGTQGGTATVNVLNPFGRYLLLNTTKTAYPGSDMVHIYEILINATMWKPPRKASGPVPFDGATDVSAVTDLSWRAGTNLTGQTVYFGIDPCSLPVVASGDGTLETVSNATLGGLLYPNTTYYWKVDGENTTEPNSFPGTVWSFTTAEFNSISVNFEGSVALDPADAAGINLAKNWNNVTGLTGTIAAGSVIDSTGAVVPGATVTWAAGTQWTPYPPETTATPGDQKLWEYSLIATPSQLGDITVTNIPYASYDVVMYMSSNWWNRGAETTVTESGITYVGMPPNDELDHLGFDGTYVQATSTDPDNPTIDATYSVHTGLTNSTSEIGWTPLTGAGMETGEGFIVGFQIVQMPRKCDFNGDWSCDSADLALFVQVWLNIGESLPQDLNSDNKVDFNDFALFAEEWLAE